MVGVLRVPRGDGRVVDGDVDEGDRASGIQSPDWPLGDPVNGGLDPAIGRRSRVPEGDLATGGRVALRRKRPQLVDLRSSGRAVGRRGKPNLTPGGQHTLLPGAGAG